MDTIEAERTIILTQMIPGLVTARKLLGLPPHDIESSADYYVGRILTWGSQTDLFIEETPGLAVTVEPGDYVYGGETVLATY